MWSKLSKPKPTAANIFLGNEMSVDQTTTDDDNLLNEVQVDAIFDSLTSSDFEADTFIRSLLNDTGLDMDWKTVSCKDVKQKNQKVQYEKCVGWIVPKPKKKYSW